MRRFAGLYSGSLVNSDYSPFLFKRQSVQSALQEECVLVREMQVIKLAFE